jgi:hypothetical protein
MIVKHYYFKAYIAYLIFTIAFGLLYKFYGVSTWYHIFIVQFALISLCFIPSRKQKKINEVWDLSKSDDTGVIDSLMIFVTSVFGTLLLGFGLWVIFDAPVFFASTIIFKYFAIILSTTVECSKLNREFNCKDIDINANENSSIVASKILKKYPEAKKYMRKDIIEDITNQQLIA